MTDNFDNKPTPLDDLELFWQGMYAHGSDYEAYGFPTVTPREAAQVLELIESNRALSAQAALDAAVVEALERLFQSTVTVLSLYEKWSKYDDRPTTGVLALAKGRAIGAMDHWVELRDAALAAREKEAK
jgi:ribosomal protein S12 methylthiotransferase accessory factor YcaO